MKNFALAMFAALSMVVVPSVAEAGGGGGGNAKSQPEIHVVNTGTTALAVAVNNSHAELVAADPAQQQEFTDRGGVVLHPGDEHTFKVHAGLPGNRVAYRAFHAVSGAPVGGLGVRTIIVERNEKRRVELNVPATTAQ